MNIYGLHLLIVISLLASTAGTEAAMPMKAGTEATTASGNIERTDRRLLKELIQLAKFNSNFRLESNYHQKWRLLFYPVEREAGTAVGTAATLIDLRQQTRGLHNPRKISRTELKEAVKTGIVANAISGGASAAQLAENSWVMLRARAHGYAPSASIASVKRIIVNTDDLLAERERAVQQEPSPETRRVLDLETKLIRKIRQQLLYEFAKWSAHSRGQAWRENVFFAIDSGQNFTRMSAGVLAFKAFGHPLLARNAAVCGLIGNSLQTINPILATSIGYAVRRHQERLLARAIKIEHPPGTKEIDELQRQLAQQQPAQQPPGQQQAGQESLRKLSTLSYGSDKIDRQLNRETAEIEHFRQVAQQQLIAGPIIGSTGVTSSMLATVAVYKYFRKPKISVRLGFTGRSTQLVGQSMALVITPVTFIRGAIRYQRLKRSGELPDQMLHARLEQLEHLEQRAADECGYDGSNGLPLNRCRQIR